MKKAIVIAIVTMTFGLIGATASFAQRRPVYQPVGRSFRPVDVRPRNEYSRNIRIIRERIASAEARLSHLYRERDAIIRHFNDRRFGQPSRGEILRLNNEISRTEEFRVRNIRMLREMRSYD